MNQEDKTHLENIYKVFSILPNDERKYLMGVADGLAAKVFGMPAAAQAQAGAREGSSAVQVSA